MAKKQPETLVVELTITLTPDEAAAIVLCAEDNHRHMLHMADTRPHDPVWRKCADASASIRRKLEGTDELT